jgi:predicted nucleic acid-binding Zn ribbon protein
MPTYVYRREDGTTFEIMQRITDDPLTVDPATGQKVTRVIGGGAGLIFKGNGFYLTDYARKNSSGAGVSSNGSETESKSEAPPTKKEEAPSSKKDG